MSEDFYGLQTDDIPIVQGDSENIEYEFKDEDGNDVDITGYDVKFTVRDPETDEVIPMLTGITTFSKYHNDNLVPGRGVYLFGDTQIAGTSVVISKNSQLVIVLDYADTVLMDYGIAYPFDIEFSKYGGSGIKFTPIKGHLIVSKEITE